MRIKTHCQRLIEFWPFSEPATLLQVQCFPKKQSYDFQMLAWIFGIRPDYLTESQHVTHLLMELDPEHPLNRECLALTNAERVLWAAPPKPTEE